MSCANTSLPWYTKDSPRWEAHTLHQTVFTVQVDDTLRNQFPLLTHELNKAPAYNLRTVVGVAPPSGTWTTIRNRAAIHASGVGRRGGEPGFRGACSAPASRAAHAGAAAPCKGLPPLPERGQLRGNARPGLTRPTGSLGHASLGEGASRIAARRTRRLHRLGTRRRRHPSSG